MKTFFLSLAGLLLMTFGMHAQCVNFHVYGQLTEVTSNAPVVNHPVMIATDSVASGGFAYSATVNTNQIGKYFKVIALPPNQVVIFTISTTDCNGQIVSVTDTAGLPAMEANFSICANLPPQPCHAKFLVHHVTGNPLSFTFTNISTGFPATYTWSFGDGDSATTIDATHTFAQTGTYNVCLTMVNNTGCTDTWCKQITINTPPPPPPVFCHNHMYWHAIGLSVKFRGQAHGGVGPHAYAWDFGDGTTDSIKKPVHVYANAGNYDVTLITTNSDGCSDTTVKTITVAAPDPGPFDIIGNVLGDSLPMTNGWVKLMRKDAFTPGLVQVDSAWVDVSGGFSFTQLPGGWYFLKAYPEPGTLFDSLFRPTYWPHNLHPGFFASIHLGPAANPYTIQLVHKGFCPFDANAGEVQGQQAKSITETSVITNQRLYPNPASSEMNIAFQSAAATQLSLSLVNIMGQIVLSQSRLVESGDHHLVLDVQNLLPGMYSLVMTTTEGTRSATRVVISR